MNHRLGHLTAALTSLVAWCLAVPVHAQDASAPQCPSEYRRHGSACIHQRTGNVVYIAATGADQEKRCAPRYRRHGEMCIDPETGDVEIAGEPTRAASK